MSRHHSIALMAAAVLISSACSLGTPTAPSRAPGAVVNPSLASSTGVEHSVTGSGFVSEDGGIDFFKVSVAAFLANGVASGETSVLIDFRNFGFGKGTFDGKVTCLEVDGNKAWIGALVSHSRIDNIVPPDSHVMAYVEDNGNSGDVMGAQVVGASVQCSDQPAVDNTHVVEKGNLTVR